MSATAQTRDDELAQAYGVAVEQLHRLGGVVCDTPLPACDIARWDATRTTLHLHPQASLEDRVWVLYDLMRAHLHGIDCADAREVERVRLVS